MKYTNIKKILNTQIKQSIKALWTWEDNNFTMIYKGYTSNNARIYTPTQLIEEINNTIEKHGETEQQIINESKKIKQENEENK